MGRIVSDNFNRANAGTLGANWTDQVVGWGIATNQAANDQLFNGDSGNAVFTGAAWTGGNDHWAEAALIACASAGWGPTVRSATASETLYVFKTGTAQAAASLQLFKAVAGVFTLLAGSNVTGFTITANDVMRTEASGTTIRGVQNSVVRYTVTDSAIASGKPGLYGDDAGASSGPTIEDWSAGDFTNLLVQKAAATQASGTTFTLTVAATGLRNLIVVGIAIGNGGAATVSTVTDNATGGTNTYLQVTGGRSSEAGGAMDVWYCKSSKAGATTITVTISSAASGDLFAFEVSGTDPTANFETVGLVNNGSASTTPVGGAVTTTTDKDFVAGFIYTDTSVTAEHAGDEFTLGNISNGNASAYWLGATPAGGPYSPQWDQTSSAFCGSTVAFQPWVVAAPVITIIPVRESHSDFPKYPMTRQ